MIQALGTVLKDDTLSMLHKLDRLVVRVVTTAWQEKFVKLLEDVTSLIAVPHSLNYSLPRQPF